jgi:multiple sugar transport system permease protein
MNRAGLVDSPIALILTYLSFQIPFCIWLLVGFFRAIPPEIEEAAVIDGCSRFHAFLAVILPLSTNGLATAAIFTFLGSWNEFLFAVTLTSTLAAKTAPVLIAESVGSYEIFWGRMAASASMYVVPALAFNFLFQRFIVRGLIAGAVKG